MPKEDFYKEIEKFYLENKGFGSQLSAKEREIVESWFKKNISKKTIKKLIIQELNRLPINKRKKFSLISVDQRINKNKKVEKQIKSESVQEDPLQKWKNYLKSKNLPENLLSTEDEDIDFAIQNNIINYFWKNMEQKEKEKIFKKVKSILSSNINLKPDEYQKALKSQIRKEIKKKYDIPD